MPSKHKNKKHRSKRSGKMPTTREKGAKDTQNHSIGDVLRVKVSNQPLHQFGTREHISKATEANVHCLAGNPLAEIEHHANDTTNAIRQGNLSAFSSARGRYCGGKETCEEQKGFLFQRIESIERVFLGEGRTPPYISGITSFFAQSCWPITKSKLILEERGLLDIKLDWMETERERWGEEEREKCLVEDTLAQIGTEHE